MKQLKCGKVRQVIFRVAQWQTKPVQSLPKSLKRSLPSIKEIEAEFGPEES
jgi:hypothetical protein